jgi:hypothetical protein
LRLETRLSPVSPLAGVSQADDTAGHDRDL